jgi:hypothetical protein
MFLRSVPDQIRSLDVSLLPIALGEVDHARTHGAKNVHAQA